MNHRLKTALVAVVAIGTTLSVDTAATAKGFTQVRKTVSLGDRILSQPYAFATSDGNTTTTYMPIWYVGQALQAAGFSQSWNGSTHTWTLTTAGQTDFSQMPVGTGGANIVVNGKLVKKLNTHVATDPAGGRNAQPTVYMPIYYVQQIFNAAGIGNSWDGRTWKIAQPAYAPIIHGFVTGGAKSLSDLSEHPEVSEFSSFTHSIGPGGAVVGTLDTDAEAYAAGHNLPAYVTVNNLGSDDNFDGKLASDTLNDPNASAALITNVVNLVSGMPFVGINMDFEMLPTSERSAYASFLSNLSSALHAQGKKLSVDLPAVTYDNSGYDYAAIGLVSDEVMIMTYDYSYPGGPAGAIAPVWWVDKVLSYAASRIAPSKTLLGLPAYGYDWLGTSTRALSLPQVDTLMAQNSITPSWDDTDKAPYFTYSSNGSTRTVFYENAQSMADKVALVQKYHVIGVSLWRMGLENSAVWTPIQQMLSQH